ncbi:hypothetical protein KXV52_002901, partial [Aspergillus fumigatus]
PGGAGLVFAYGGDGDFEVVAPQLEADAYGENGPPARETATARVGPDMTRIGALTINGVLIHGYEREMVVMSEDILFGGLRRRS